MRIKPERRVPDQAQAPAQTGETSAPAPAPGRKLWELLSVLACRLQGGSLEHRQAKSPQQQPCQLLQLQEVGAVLAPDTRAGSHCHTACWCLQQAAGSRQRKRQVRGGWVWELAWPLAAPVTHRRGTAPPRALPARAWQRPAMRWCMDELRGGRGAQKSGQARPGTRLCTWVGGGGAAGAHVGLHIQLVQPRLLLLRRQLVHGLRGCVRI